jgi:hypothetical protein
MSNPILISRPLTTNPEVDTNFCSLFWVTKGYILPFNPSRKFFEKLADRIRETGFIQGIALEELSKFDGINGQLKFRVIVSIPHAAEDKWKIIEEKLDELVGEIQKAIEIDVSLEMVKK